jgi:hypothetical protein
MITRASEPPMKLRLFAESAILKVSECIDLSGVEESRHALMKFNQQKLLIGDPETNVNKNC